MARICVFGGLGKIGEPLIKFLSVLGHEVNCCDSQYDINSDEISDVVNRSSARAVFYSEPEDITEKAGYDMFVSCAPTSLNERIRLQANKLKIKYVDFGGDVEHQDMVRDDFLNCEHGVLTGVGLAPGYMNMIISEGLKFLVSKGYQPKRVFMYVGGIASDRNCNVLGWIPTWSIDGLIQSYKGPCRYLKGGNIVDDDPCCNLAQIPLDFYGNVYSLEAFGNSGGMSHTLYEALDLGVKDCYYYTLRWPGHLSTIKAMFLVANKFGISDEDLKKYIYELTANTGIDIVVGKACIEYDANREDGGLNQDVVTLRYFAEQGYSAMQLATAIPAAATINCILKNDLKGYLTYSDLDYKEIENDIAIIRTKLNMDARTGKSIVDAHEQLENDKEDE